MILQTVVIAISLGILAQAVASRLKLPAILPLLLLGMLCGPSGLSWFYPGALGDTLEPLIHLGVAIILFEGGLSIDLERLRKVGGAVRNLLSFGVAITGGLSAWLAHSVVGMPWPTAILFGAIVTVTGPTVIAPLLRHTIAPQSVKTILHSEGLIIDAIGALLAYLVLQWIELQGMAPSGIGIQVLKVTATGCILGFVGGAAGRTVARSRLFDAELSNLVILALLMMVYMISEGQAHQSGILAAVVMGFTLSAAKVPDLGPLKAFKGQLTTLLISVLFILLSGQLDLEEMINLGGAGLLVTAGLIFLVRPASVFLSVMPWQLGLKERSFLAMTAPRGIVAAAVASLAARQLDAANIDGGSLLEGLVYMAILGTGAWATVMSLVLPVALGYKQDASRRRAVVVGANPLAETIAELMQETGRTTVVVDSVSWRLERFRRKEMETVRGDARDAGTYEQAGVERDSIVIAATTNDELNLLVAELVHHEFGIEHPVVALQRPPDELGRRSRAWLDLLALRDIKVPAWIRRLENGTAERIELPYEEQRVAALVEDLLDEFPNQVLLLAGWRGDNVIFRVDLKDEQSIDRIALLVSDGPVKERLKGLLAELEEEAAAEERAEAEQAEAAEPNDQEPNDKGSGEESSGKEKPSGTAQAEESSEGASEEEPERKDGA
ncbi:MAG: cation:proton antiporter [Acidobacteriota bacterium]|nr:cation:proton antiporter [Acidobacteriota bacterium]